MNATYRMTSCVAREMIVSVPLASTTRYDGTENTDGCKVHDGCDDFQAYFIDGINQIQEWSSFFTDCDQCETDDQGKHQNLEHVSVSKCGDWVGRDQVFRVSRILLISVAWISAVAISNLTPFPRWISLGMISPHRLASAVVQRK